MRKAPKIFALTGTVALLATACSSGGGGGGGNDTTKDPMMALKDASDALSSEQVVSMELSIDGEYEDFVALGNDTSDMTEEDVKMLTNSSISVVIDSGENAEDATDDKMSAKVKLDGEDLADIVVTNTAMFLKVDLDVISKIDPDTASSIDEMRSTIDQYPELSSLKPLLEGEWVTVDEETFMMLTSMLEESGMDAGNAAEGLKAVQEAMSSIIKDATTVRDESNENQINVTFNVKEAADKLGPALQQLSGAADSIAPNDLTDPTNIPDEDITVNFILSDDKFETIQVDMAQFADAPKGPVLIKAVMSYEGSVDEPTDAEVIDLTSLFGSMGMS